MFSEDLCAHSRAQIVGCRRCLDLCPTGAIVPNGDHVAIDARICAGCGQCAAVCPTGAAAYALPPSDALLRKLRTLLIAYREAGGAQPVLLFHDGEQGARADRRAGALRRRLAGECAAGRGQRDHASWAGGDRRRLSPMAPARCVSSPAPSRATIWPASTRPSRWRSRCWPGSALPAAASRPSRPTIPMRSAQTLRAIAADGRRGAAGNASRPSARSRTWCGSLCANCTRRRRRRSMSSRCRRARPSAPSR